MKVTFETKDPVVGDEYPCFKVYDQNSSGRFVVLFDEPRVGTVVASDNPLRAVGERKAHFTMSYFRPFHGTITVT